MVQLIFPVEGMQAAEHEVQFLVQGRAWRVAREIVVKPRVRGELLWGRHPIATLLYSCIEWHVYIHITLGPYI